MVFEFAFESIDFRAVSDKILLKAKENKLINKTKYISLVKLCYLNLPARFC